MLKLKTVHGWMIKLAGGLLYPFAHFRVALHTNPEHDIRSSTCRWGTCSGCQWGSFSSAPRSIED